MSNPKQVQNLELLDSRSEQASRRDNSDDNLWESERREKAAAAEQRKSAAEGSKSNGESYQGSGSGSDPVQQARAKQAEDKWWSSTPAAPTQTDASWWDEDPGTVGRGGSAAGSSDVESNSLPSFFDE